MPPADDDDLKIDTTGLSDEEIEALESDDDEDALDDILDDDDEKQEKGKKSDPVPDEVDDDDEPEAKKTTDKAVETTEATDEAEVDDKSAPEFIPLLRAEKVENYDERMADINTKLDDLDSKLEDGDIDLKQYTKEVRALSEEQTDLKMAKLTADNAEQNNLDVATQRWQWEIDQFFGEEANKIYKDSKMLSAALDAAVKEIAGKPENVNRNGAWFLKEADKEVRKEFGKATPDNKVVDIKGARKPNLTNIPKTLGNLPSADTNEIGDNEFAYLDDLEGMDYENALASLERKDPEKASRYLKSA